MSSFANTFKSEIARIARKEFKDDLAALRKTTTTQRSEIAALKRDLKALTTALKQAQRRLPVAEPKAKPSPTPTRRAAFSADKLAEHRASLGFTQAQMARLIGASALSVYKWESGKVQPRAAQLAQIAAAMQLGKREARARVAGD